MNNNTVEALRSEGLIVDQITITTAEYRGLLEANILLHSLCRMIVQEKPYAIANFRAIVGEELIPVSANESEGR